MLKNEKIIIFVLLAIIFLLYLPILAKPELILNRGNDLQEQFWPIFYFINKHLWADHQLPLWNNVFLSGTPILPDPQFSLFYPGNFLFYVFPTSWAFIIYFLLHGFLGGMGVYLLTKRVFNFSKNASLFTVALYIFTPIHAGYIEAGHYGLIGSSAYLPFLLLAVIKQSKEFKAKWILLWAISLAGLFFTHSINFALATVVSILIFIYLSFKRLSSHVLLGIFGTLSVVVILTFGLTAVTLLPQLEWLPSTTRSLLLNDRDVYPKWEGKKEFLATVFAPWVQDKNKIWETDTEKWIALGIFPTLLALYGLSKTPKRITFGALVLITTVLLVSLNNISPLYPLLLKFNWYVFMRVATRVWFIPILALAILAGLGFDSILKKNKPLGYIIAFFALAETLALSWLWLEKPPNDQSNFVPEKVYQYLASDKDRFRVFCVTRCLSQKKASQYNLELAEGYNTLQQKNYFKHSWQLMGGYWNYYTLAIPPIGVYHFEKLQPDARSLGEFNVKYIISPYRLIDKNFVLVKQIENSLIYKNKQVLPRSYFWTEDLKPASEARVIQYTPNFIRVDTNQNKTTRLVIAEVYSPGWKAYLNGKEEVRVQEKPNTLRLVDIKPDTRFVDFKYEPDSFKIGLLITAGTLIFLISWLIKNGKIISFR